MKNYEARYKYDRQTNTFYHPIKNIATFGISHILLRYTSL